VPIYDRGDAPIGIDREILRPLLLQLPQIQSVQRVWQSQLFEYDRDLAAIGGRSCIEVDHQAGSRIYKECHARTAARAAAEKPVARLRCAHSLLVGYRRVIWSTADQ